jgi:YD repeat-containing protein
MIVREKRTMARMNTGGIAIFLLIGAFLASGQNLMDEMFHIPHPPNPPLMALLRVMGAGKMVTDASLPLKGSVARVEYQEHNSFRLSDSPPALLRNLVQEFDEKGRVVTEVEIGRARSVMTYRDDRPLTRETTILAGGKSNGPLQQQTWTYDVAGRLTEFRSSQGGKVQNHFTNFRYDAQGRIKAREYHQGPADALQSRVEYDYSADGRRISEVTFDEKNERIQTSVRAVDERGQVSEYEFANRDWKTHEWNKPRHFRFKYDEKGRMTEQDADPEKPGTFQDEQSIPAGKVSIVFDDEKGTREIAYSLDGTEVHSRQKLDENGAIVEMSVSSRAGGISAVFECSYDAHGNWTECKRWGEKDGERRMSGWWTRNITYRLR